MSSENRATEMSEMRSGLDTVSGDTSENVFEVQHDDVGNTEEEYDRENEEELNPEQIRFKVELMDEDRIGKPVFYLEYFNDYQSAMDSFNNLCNDSEFIRNYDEYQKNSFLSVTLSKAYRGMGQMFWEVIRRSTIYNSKHD